MISIKNTLSATTFFHNISMATSNKVFNSVDEAIGNTPLIRLNKIPQSVGIQAKIYAKCGPCFFTTWKAHTKPQNHAEFFNPGGSVKDRIGLRMIVDAEKSGRIQKGKTTLIEATSGNTGIGLALCANLKGYPTIITLPEKMSQEKVGVLEALGARIVRTPTEARFDSPESHIGVALKLKREIPFADILDQYENKSNPDAHDDGTGKELLLQMGSQPIDVFVCTVGTGGTITGIARSLKRANPKCIVVGVDPHGSILAQPETLNVSNVTSYKVEGIGYDFIPRVLDRDVVDFWVKTGDAESFAMSRRIIREEGMLVGGSSGAALEGVLQAFQGQLKHLNRPNVNCVVLFADSVRNYMTKFLRDKWMLDNGFSHTLDRQHIARAVRDEWNMENKGLLTTLLTKQNHKANATLFSTKLLHASPQLLGTLTVKQALEVMVGSNKVPFLVVTLKQDVLGVITESDVLRMLAYEAVTWNAVLQDCVDLFPRFKMVTTAITLEEAAKWLESVVYLVCSADDHTFQIVSHGDLLREIILGSKL